MKTAFALAFTLVLFGCNSPNQIAGELSLDSPLNVITGGGKQETVASGTYDASVVMTPAGGEVRIQISGDEIVVPVPKLVADSKGQINFSTTQLGQRFTVQGQIYDARENFDRVVSGSCVLGSRQVYRCIANPTTAGAQTCGYVAANDYGLQDVHETGYFQKKVITFKLVDNSPIGSFKGSFPYHEVVETSVPVSACR
ncbi:MAG: hypothetical protein ACXVB9_17610 [Bdellovibrionota bacterium]